MKKRILAALILLALPNVLIANASTYGKPYGSSDTTAVERSDVKTIDQLNRTTELEERDKAEDAEPVVEVPEQASPEPDPDPVVEESAQEADPGLEPVSADGQENKIQ